MLKTVAWLEIVLSVLLLGIAIWPFTGLCSGRFIGLDCESQAIFSVNMFAPAGILLLVCAAWSLKRRSVMPQYFLIFGIAVVLSYWLSETM